MEQLFSKKKIKNSILKLAGEINNSYFHPKGRPDKFVFICVLKGGFLFFSTLCKHTNLDIEIDFIQTKTYDGKKQSKVALTKDIDIDINGKIVYLVDDFLDSANTMKFLIKHLKTKNPKKIIPVTLLKRHNAPIIENHKFCLEVKTDKWLYGYGMDRESIDRNLSIIYTI